MRRALTLASAARPWLIVAALLAVFVFTAPLWLTPLAATRLRASLRAKGYEPAWRELHVALPAGVHVRELSLRRPNGDTLLTVRTLDASARLLSLLTLHPAIAHAEIDGLVLHMHGGDDEDAAAPATDVGDDTDVPPAVAERVRSVAGQFAKALLVPARSLPSLRLTDARFLRPDSTGLALDAVTLERRDDAVELVGTGTLRLEQPVPVDVALHWRHDDHLDARAEFKIPDAEHGTTTPLVLSLAGVVTQDRHTGQLRVAEGTRAHIGDMGMAIAATVDTHGPRFTFRMAMDSLDQARVTRSLPRAVLGPLADMSVVGTWDWHVHADLDLAQPDSVDFGADVIPHGLELDERTATLKLGALSRPFVATIHLPKGRIAHRDLSPMNPHFRSLDRISPFLQHALVTNEDGGFFSHRGFNTDAIKLAVAANLRSGSYKRGAGTITMQLVRNLYLGHQRTLSRKAQEVVLAWLLEHRTQVPKERLLEIYLNIIEWGPGLHGVDEAARFYFDTDASELTLDQALFLTILVPSPSKWRWRFDTNGQLKPYARAQMRFIAGKMVSKGWLDSALMPAADSLHVTLRGPAAALFVPHTTPGDSGATPHDDADPAAAAR